MYEMPQKHQYLVAKLYIYANFMLYKKLEYAKIESRNQTDNIRETTS